MLPVCRALLWTRRQALVLGSLSLVLALSGCVSASPAVRARSAPVMEPVSVSVTMPTPLPPVRPTPLPTPRAAVTPTPTPDIHATVTSAIHATASAGIRATVTALNPPVSPETPAGAQTPAATPTPTPVPAPTPVPPALVRGTVLFPDGEPGNMARVIVRGESDAARVLGGTWADAKGRYEFALASEGTYYINTYYHATYEDTPQAVVSVVSGGRYDVPAITAFKALNLAGRMAGGDRCTESTDPRNCKLDGQPRFYWNVVPGASHYILQVRSANSCQAKSAQDYNWSLRVAQDGALWPDTLTYPSLTGFRAEVSAYNAAGARLGHGWLLFTVGSGQYDPSPKC